MAPGAGLAKTDIIKDVIRVMGGNTFSHLVGGDKEKSGSARLGKAADAGVLHFHLLCFALLLLIGIHGHCCHLLVVSLQAAFSCCQLRNSSKK